MVDLAKAQKRLAAKQRELEDLSDLSADSRDPVELDHASCPQPILIG